MNLVPAWAGTIFIVRLRKSSDYERGQCEQLSYKDSMVSIWIIYFHPTYRPVCPSPMCHLCVFSPPWCVFLPRMCLSLACIACVYCSFVCLFLVCLPLRSVSLPHVYLSSGAPGASVSVIFILLLFVLIIKESKPKLKLSNNKSGKENLLTVVYILISFLDPWMYFSSMCIRFFSEHLNAVYSDGVDVTMTSSRSRTARRDREWWTVGVARSVLGLLTRCD